MPDGNAGAQSISATALQPLPTTESDTMTMPCAFHVIHAGAGGTGLAALRDA